MWSASVPPVKHVKQQRDGHQSHMAYSIIYQSLTVHGQGFHRALPQKLGEELFMGNHMLPNVAGSFNPHKYYY